MSGGAGSTPEVDRRRVFGETPESPERIAPGYFSPQVEAEHLARYRWASRGVRGLTVLDAACGTGYGSATLRAAGARFVCAVDVSAAALGFARATYPRAAYVRADALDLPIRAAAVDVVVSLETIEHLTDGRRFLRALRGILRPGGTLFLSSPNGPATGARNPYHVHEMDLDELRGLLRATGFRAAGLWGQYWRLPSRHGVWRFKGLGRLAHYLAKWPRVWRAPDRLGLRPDYWCVRAVADAPIDDRP